MLYMSALTEDQSISMRPIVVMKLLWPVITTFESQKITHVCGQFIDRILKIVELHLKVKDNIYVILEFLCHHLQIEHDRNVAYLNDSKANSLLEAVALMYNNHADLSSESIKKLDVVLMQLIVNYSCPLQDQLVHFESIETWKTLLECWVCNNGQCYLLSRLQVISNMQYHLQRTNLRLPWYISAYVLRTMEDYRSLSAHETNMICAILLGWFYERSVNKERPSYDEIDLFKKVKEIGCYDTVSGIEGSIIYNLESQLKEIWGIEC